MDTNIDKSGVGKDQTVDAPAEDIKITDNTIEESVESEVPAEPEVFSEPEIPSEPIKPVVSDKSTEGEDPSKKKRNIIIACVVGAILILGGVLLGLVLSGNAPWQNKVAKILDVTPTEMDNGIIGENTHFLVKAENGSVEKIRNAIYLEPAIDYEIKEVRAGSEYEIIPATTLADNTLFNIDSVSGDVISYKWAFQTKNDLSVSRIYPANGAGYVSENTVIEFSFSYPNIDGVEDHFSISPQVEGKLEKLEHSWRFTPSSPLAVDSTYEITITAGLTYGDEVMKKDFHSSFSTFTEITPSSNIKSKGITLDGVSTFTESENPVVEFANSDRDLFAAASYVTVGQIANADDFINHLRGEQVEITTLGDYAFEKVDAGSRGKFAVLDQTLLSGYYTFSFKADNGQNLYTADIEVNNLAAYAFESERDAIVWVAENGELKSGIKVNFKGKDYETGENGLLSISNISDYSENLDYLKIGNNGQPLVIALKNFKNDLYPRGFIYTDRPLYTPNDTVKIWGYVPLQFFKDQPRLDGFSVAFDEIKLPITVDADGFFTSEIKLENYKDTHGYITLSYNGIQIASKYMSVENYSLENYIYEFITNDSFVDAGDNIDFSIKVSHVTGFPAINKDIVVTYDGHDYYGTTNGAGEVGFSFPTVYEPSSWERPSYDKTVYFSVKSAGAEYNKYSTSKVFTILKNDLELKHTKTDVDAGTVTFEANNLDITKKKANNYREIERTAFSGPATIRVYEDLHYRYIGDYRYNEYTKENTPVYYTSYTTMVIEEVPVTIENGKIVYNYPTNYKESTEDSYYSYRVAIGAVDANGRPSYAYGITYHSGRFLGQSTGGSANYDAIVPYRLFYSPVSNYSYNLYKFGIKDTVGESPYSIGDTLRLGIYDYDNSNLKNEGSILAIEYHEDILGYEVTTEDTIDVKFDKKAYPGIGVTGAYFVDGKFNRIAPMYSDYDEADSNLDIKIETDKASYEPGDTVKVKLTITRADGSRASGKVNLSVVNEAIFNNMSDNTSILSTIYSNKLFKSYSMSTYRDYELDGGGGMGSTAGGRSNFGDTVFFGDKAFSNGEVEFEFKLNDSITSFRLTALAVENGDVINAGVGIGNVSSYLPLSISTVIPKKVKNTDDLVLNATSIVSSGDSIDYTFTIEELNKVLTASALPGQSVSVNFGKLDLGQYTVTIAGQDSVGNTDKMVYTIDIIETAQEVAIKNTVELSNEIAITPAKNPIVIEFYDKETAQYIKYLDFLESNRTVRLDTLAAYYKSLEYKNKYYNEDSASAVPKFTAYMAPDGRLAPLTSAEGDFILTALVNEYMPDYFDLDVANYGINIGDERSTILGKLLVQASFKRPVLIELQALSEMELTPDEKLIVALAFAFAGDYDSAKDIYENTDFTGCRQDLLAILETFIDKESASKQIDTLMASTPAAEYLSFAIISFFENNEIDLNKKSTVTVDINSENDRIEIHPLEVVKKVYYSDNLAEIKIHPGSNNLMATYYYQGKITEVDDTYNEDIGASLEGGLYVGETAYLVLDISKIAANDRNGELNIALPSNLKFSGTFTGEDGLYLVRNNNEYVKLSLSEFYTNNLIRIPLYIAAPGNYELEPIIYNDGEGFHFSNGIVFDTFR